MTGPTTTVHLLRHGEVDNPAGVLYGRLPGFVLSAAGHRMAELSADALAGRDIVAVVSSPLERARETATPVAGRLDLDVTIDERLIEAASALEGEPVGMGRDVLAHPRYWRHLTNPLRPSWGEPYAEVAARMLAAATSARDLARADGGDHEAVCVSHQLPIWTLRRSVEGRHLWHRPDVRQCGLASLTSLTWQGERVVSVTYTEPAGALTRTPSTPGA
ncbi:MAG: histidine phosphatase family protein [Actinomycetota bacterium]|nr:histidine phosphatase family protein [Actinomycetota bacterium]